MAWLGDSMDPVSSSVASSGGVYQSLRPRRKCWVLTQRILKISTGWWFQPLWKIWKSGWWFPIYGKHVPNHQPVKIWRQVVISHRHWHFTESPSTHENTYRIPWFASAGCGWIPFKIRANHQVLKNHRVNTWLP